MRRLIALAIFSVAAAASAAEPSKIVLTATHAAIIDGLHNQVRLIDLATNRDTLLRTGETPVDGAFIGNDFFVINRDASTIERLTRNESSLPLAADPAFVREARGMLYAYSRTAGVLQEIAPSPFAIRRTARVPRFAAAMESDGRNIYLVDPRAAKVHVISLNDMKPAGDIDVGAVPVDLAIANGSALSAHMLAVADPAAKKVWLIEGQQSTSQAFARGFLRGLLGLGLFENRTSQFPTGVDRVFIRGNRWIAYDSSTGTLYRFTKSASSVVARDVAPGSFAVTERGVTVWDGTRLRQLP